MDKLYPPIIGDKIPGFQNDNNSIIVSVPFENNRSVGYSSIYSIVLRLKTVQTDSLVLTCLPKSSDVDGTGRIKESIINETKIVHFSLPTDSETLEKLNYGQFYKIQLAYISMNGGNPPSDWHTNVGYYSNVGMSKYTSEPILTIQGLEVPPTTNTHKYNYVGEYSQKVNSEINDTTEKAYQYRFTITGGSVNVDSGWLLHDSSNDENEYSSYDTWEYLHELPNGNYAIDYFVLSNSGIEYSSNFQVITGGNAPLSGITLNPILNFYDGYIDIFVTSSSVSSDKANTYILRKNEETGEIVRLGKAINDISSSEDQNIKVFRDFTFEQGYHYSYAIWIKNPNTGVYAPYTYCDPIYSDFEDIFLYDGERQLKIRFNPSVSGIHETIPESKQDTIGGKYPIFFRNGNVRYRDFTLNGLISFQMDENRLFSEYGVADQPSRERTYTTALDNSDPPKLHSFVIPTDLVGENFYHERMFREEVLAWLNNGKLKLFRSSSEGIMIVKTMNVNMTPEQIPSRMIYNFSCQMYEAMGHEYEDLVKANIIIRD